VTHWTQLGVTQMAGPDPAFRLAATEAIAREAGALALRYFRNREALAVERKGLQDIVSLADREVEDLIRTRVGALFPDDGVLGEEAGLSPGAEGTWVVDPIDGTWCFLNGITSWCVSIAYVEDGRTEIGVIYHPETGELFTACRGHGARLDGRPIRVLDAASLQDGTLSVGYSQRAKAADVAPLIERLLERGGMYHCHGSGALGLAWTACGRLIGYVEPHMNSWDALAGLLLIEEAGGLVNDFLAGDGLMKGNRTIGIAPKLRDAVAELAPWTGI
jgi:myo-inositol-1(or 4)-monophosphatase